MLTKNIPVQNSPPVDGRFVMTTKVAGNYQTKLIPTTQVTSVTSVDGSAGAIDLTGKYVLVDGTSTMTGPLVIKPTESTDTTKVLMFDDGANGQSILSSMFGGITLLGCPPAQSIQLGNYTSTGGFVPGFKVYPAGDGTSKFVNYIQVPSYGMEIFGGAVITANGGKGSVTVAKSSDTKTLYIYQSGAATALQITRVNNLDASNTDYILCTKANVSPPGPTTTYFNVSKIGKVSCGGPIYTAVGDNYLSVYGDSFTSGTALCSFVHATAGIQMDTGILNAYENGSTCHFGTVLNDGTLTTGVLDVTTSATIGTTLGVTGITTLTGGLSVPTGVDANIDSLNIATALTVDTSLIMASGNAFFNGLTNLWLGCSNPVYINGGGGLTVTAGTTTLKETVVEENHWVLGELHAHLKPWQYNNDVDPVLGEVYFNVTDNVLKFKLPNGSVRNLY